MIMSCVSVIKKVILHVHSDWYSPYAYNEAELFLIWIFFFNLWQQWKKNVLEQE